MTVADVEGAAPDERRRFYDAAPVRADDPRGRRDRPAAGRARRRHSALDRVAAFAEACRARSDPARSWSPRARRPRSSMSRPAPGLVVRPDGGYAPSPLHPWVPVGTTGVIRRAERNSEIVAEREVDVIVIPGELYARAWLRPLGVDELAGATRPPVARRMTMTTIERVVALHRVPTCSPTSRVGPSPPSPAGARGRRRRRRDRHRRGRRGGPPVRGGRRVACACTAGTGRCVELGAGSTVGELAALVPEPRSASVTALEPTLLLRIDKPSWTSCSPTGPRSRAGSSPRSSPWSANERTPRPTRRPRDRARASRSGGRALADVAVAGLRRDGRAARDRRQRDVPGRLRLGVAAGDVHRDRRGRGSRSRAPSRGARSGSTSCGSRSSCWAGPRPLIARRVAHRRGRQTGRGCRRRCWCCSRS